MINNAEKNINNLTISVCIISKNEENSIKACLESISSIADEIIVLDTGSTDETINISENFGAKVYKYKWNDNFSDARNKCISYAKNKWILYLDSDELLSKYTQDNLVSYLKTLDHDKPIILCFKVINPIKNSINVTTFYRSAVFRNGFDIKFKGVIHEQLYSDLNNLIIKECPSFEIFHKGNITRNNIEKSEKYIDLILKAIKDHETKDIRYYYYFQLGNAYFDKKDFNNSLEYYLKSKYEFERLNTNLENNVYGNNLLMIIQSYIKLKKFSDSLIFSEKLLKLYPDFPDALYSLGLSYQYLGDFEKSKNIYEKILKLNNFDKFNLDTAGQTLIPKTIIELSRCIFILGNKEKAINLLINLEKRFENNPEILLYLLYFSLINQKIEDSIKFYLKNPLTNNRFLDNLDVSKDSRIIFKKLLKSMFNASNIWLDAEKKNIILLLEELDQ